MTACLLCLYGSLWFPEKVNKEISEVYRNIDKTLHLFADGRIYQAASAQQYVLTAANNLADLLSNFLNSMELQMSQAKAKEICNCQILLRSQEDEEKQAEESQGSAGESPMSRGGPNPPVAANNKVKVRARLNKPTGPGQSPFV